MEALVNAPSLLSPSSLFWKTSFAEEILSEFLFILQNSVQSYYQLLQKASRPHMLPNLFRSPFMPPSPTTAKYHTNHVTALWKRSVWGATKWSHTLFNFTSDLIDWKYLIVRREYFKTDFLNRFIFCSFVLVSVSVGICRHQEGALDPLEAEFLVVANGHLWC